MENISHDVAVKTLQQTQRVVKLRVSRVVFNDDGNVEQPNGGNDNNNGDAHDDDVEDIEHQESGLDQQQDENFVTSHMDAIEVCASALNLIALWK